MNYQDWNGLLASYLFNSERAGKEVLLYVTDELINKLGEPYKCGVSDYISVVKGERPAREICLRALELFRSRIAGSKEYPPYIGILGLFVLTDVSSDEDHAAHAFYPKLWARLGEPHEQHEPPHFGEMIDLWDDLEKWSRIDMGEEFGRFVARYRGGWINVGLLRSQTLLSEDERNNLPKLFFEAGLEPGDPPNGEALAALLNRCRQVVLIGCLYPRTRKLLFNRGGDVALRNALLDLLSEELEGWDGKNGDEENDGSFSEKQALRIEIEDIGGSFGGPVRAKLRIWSRLPYPEDQVVFDYDDEKWTCTEATAGWSYPIRVLGSSPARYLQPNMEFWRGNGKLVDKGLGWGARQRKTQVRLFRRGGYEIPLPGWLEMPRLNRDMEFLIIVEAELAVSVAAWGVISCGEFSDLSVTGLPDGWKLFRGRNVQKSHPDIPALTISAQSSLRLVGGMKPGRGNTYLSFAPPKIIVDNIPPDIEVVLQLNGKPIFSIPGSNNIFDCPTNLTLNTAHQVKLLVGDDEKKTIFHLVEPGINDLKNMCPYRKTDGNITDSVGVAHMIRGVEVTGMGEFEPLGILSRPNGVLLGRHTNEVWTPVEGPIPDWPPVWCICKTGSNSFSAIFCQSSLNAEWGPLKCESQPDRKTGRWREYIWVNRRRTTMPGPRAVARLWKEYMEIAKNV